MNEKQKRVAKTHLGEVEYDTVECSSCEQEMLEEDAKRVVVGELQNQKTLSYKSTVKCEFSQSGFLIGWLCEHCCDMDNMLRLQFRTGFTWTVAKWEFAFLLTMFLAMLLAVGSILIKL